MKKEPIKQTATLSSAGMSKAFTREPVMSKQILACLGGVFVRHLRLLDDRHRRNTSQTSEILLGEGATLTASVLPDDTCAVWSKRHNEEANPKESLCEEDSASTLREARGCQAP